MRVAIDDVSSRGEHGVDVGGQASQISINSGLERTEDIGRLLVWG